MIIEVDNVSKITEIWLSNEEKNDKIIEARLEEIYTQSKKDKFLVVVFESGKSDLIANTKDLLLNNRNIS